MKFEKLGLNHIDAVFFWLEQDHVKEFWDNSQEHRDDIICFVHGRVTPSEYCDGQMHYWIASKDELPYAMIMIEQIRVSTPVNDEKIERLSRTGNTYGLDFMIGDPAFVGKGLGAQTLAGFIDFYRQEIDTSADVFQIDPEDSNPKAKHVYEKAGFELVSCFIMVGSVSGAGKPTQLLVKKFPPIVHILDAGLADYPAVQNMARFYVYDLSKECGHISKDWIIPSDGLYESFDFREYFENTNKKAHLIKVYNELAGFVLINREVHSPDLDFNMGEFFILGKFQGTGVAQRAAYQVFDKYPGRWQVSVIPQNKKGIHFWEGVISKVSNNHFKKEVVEISFDKDQPKRVVFNF